MKKSPIHEMFSNQGFKTSIDNLFHRFEFFFIGNILYHNVTGLIANEKYLFVVLATNQYGGGTESVPTVYDNAFGKFEQFLMKNIL